MRVDQTETKLERDVRIKEILKKEDKKNNNALPPSSSSSSNFLLIEENDDDENEIPSQDKKRDTKKLIKREVKNFF